MTFIRTKEDFKCEHCGVMVIGNGYTNHCPECLWSKHVDIDPGDRRATCGGLMEPIGLIMLGDTEKIIQHCVTCGHTRNQKRSPNDNPEVYVLLARKVV